MSTRLLSLSLTAALAAPLLLRAAPPGLPGELPAADVLDGKHPFPPSPKVPVKESAAGFDAARLGKVPAPGVHPRILISPDQLPDLRKRLRGTEVGRVMLETLRARVAASIGRQGTWEAALYDALAAGRTDEALAIFDRGEKPSSAPGHYQPHILYAMVLESLDALIAEDAKRGEKAAAAVAGYANMIAPLVERVLAEPLADDIWRVKPSGRDGGKWSGTQGVRDLVGYQLLGYAYDFAAPFMTDAQRADVRRVIARVTSGRLWMGARLPEHFRNWNWVAVGASQPLLALAIEGEEGYDPRVYRLGVEILRDYFTYGISEMGSSTEAVGYTQFGLVWANPFAVAAARRGDNLLTHGHHRAMMDWYLQSMQPFGGAWVSHGDGGDRGPEVWTMAMWKYYFPRDPKTDFLWQSVLRAGGPDYLRGRYHLVEPLLFAQDPDKGADGKWVDYRAGATLNAPLTWFDALRSSLITRTAWNADALALQFECRTDSVGASHEHADRTNFTLAALGRSWAKDNFRSVETRHHNNILIDGRGQGFWPGPGKWVGLAEDANFVVAAGDAKPAYDWMWPKQIATEDPESFVRFQFARWRDYQTEARLHREVFGDLRPERDDRPAVVAFWQGFESGDPRLWDEDAWPVRYPWNPVQRAFRTVALARGEAPYVLVVDDIQKDDQERLYEWLMQTGMNTEVFSNEGDDIILGDATVARDAEGRPRPKKGDRALLVRVLDRNDPGRARDYTTRPSTRLETYERRDTLVAVAKSNALSGGRSFGLDKRLVIPSRSVAPDFKILLFPHRVGDPLPVTTWNEDRTKLTIVIGRQTDTVTFSRNAAGRNELALARGGEKPVRLNP